MRRIFTAKAGRYNIGDVRDYPAPVWKTISRSAKKPLDKITRMTDEAAGAAVRYAANNKA